MRRMTIHDVARALLLVAIARATIAAPSPQATGTISGTVTDGSAPVAAAFVSFLTPAGSFLESAQTNGLGVYTSPALPAGSYYVRVTAPYGSGLIDELYNDVTCPFGACALTAGTLVSVTAGVGTSNIQFVLASGGWFQGTITNQQTGTAVAEAYVRVYSAAGEVGYAPLTPPTGAYKTTALPPGTYYLEAFAPSGSGLRHERYENVSCEGVACVLTSGTAIPITVPGGNTIDFALAPGAVIAGTVTKEPFNAPLPNVRLDFYAANGLNAGAAATDALGHYTSPGLPPGTYFVLTEVQPGDLVVDELYNDIPCPNRICVITSATPVVISGTGTFGNIDFVLGSEFAPVITTQPSAAVVWEGQTATFTVAAIGVPSPSTQWQTSADAGVTWADANGATGTTYAFGTAAADNGKRVRAVFTNSRGTATTVAATLTVNPCLFSLSPVATAPYTGASATISVQSGSGCAWVSVSNVPWLTITGGSGVGPGMIGYTVAPYGGTVPRTGVITIAGHAVQITQSGIPTMAIDRTSMTLSVITNGAALLASTQPQAVHLTQNAFGPVSWTATSSHPLVWVSPASGQGPATLSVGVAYDAGVPGPGTTAATITLTYTGAANAGAQLTILLNVIPEGTSAQPFGRFDTPLDGATGVAGSIAVTGWALDDVGVTRLLILRDPVEGEGSGPVYIGDATFVDGARPDVHAAYSTYPQSTRAGWGYMLLTNFLPGRGNGSFKLYAAALDAEGHSTTLASTTITCDNANSTAPFGAIDTPGQGATWAGVQTNFGWVISPGSRRADPPGGGVVNVFIDGVHVGSPTGWTARSDISALFPTEDYEGASTAVAGFGVDTRLLSNGVHSIFWVVTASSGGAAGVGSRYFTVANAQVSGLREAVSLMQPPAPVRARPTDVNEIVSRAPVDPSTIRGRRGFDLQAALIDFAPEDGRTLVQAEELDRIELRLATAAGHTFTGYLRTIDGLGPLPAGSALDSATGTFTWGAGPGFIGTYDFSFVRWTDGEAVARQDVRVVLNPRRSDRVGPQVVIDVPVAAQGRPAVVDRSFFLSGWAIDLDSPADAGMDAVHVWAYPVDATGTYQWPQFLGPAIFGGSRPDVGATYGLRFETSGYGMIVQALAPGTYDIAVFAHSTLRNDFVPAKTVRVVVR